MALCSLAATNGSRIVTPTREQLSKLIGIRRHKTISDALTALENAAWINRTHVPVSEGGVQTATLLRIVLLRAIGALPGKGDKAPHTTRSAVEGENRPKTLSEREAHRATAGQAAAGAPESAEGHQPTEGQGRSIADLVAEALGHG